MFYRQLPIIRRHGQHCNGTILHVVTIKVPILVIEIDTKLLIQLK